MTTHTVAIATSAAFPDLFEDDFGLLPALEALGITAKPCVWNDPSVDWAAYDAVLVRSVWDYFQHYAAFRAWLDALDATGIPTINDTALLRWNSDKRYLVALAQSGVDVIETEICAAGDLLAVVGAHAGDVVVKPTTSGNAWHLVRGTAGDPAFGALLDALPRDLEYLVQPYVPEIETAGEWSMIFIDGEFSHGIRKLPAAGDFRIQHEYGGQWHPTRPDAWMIDDAEFALHVVAALGFADQAYARVDGVIVDGDFRLMELEMVEPFLAFHMAPNATDALAKAVALRVL